MFWRFFILVALIPLTACGATVRSGAHEVDKSDYETSVEQLAPQAAFDMDCPQRDLEYVVLRAVDGPWGKRLTRTMGVKGCDRRMTYVWSREYGWVANVEGSSDQAQSPTNHQ